MGIKIGVFDAAEYDGGVLFSKTFPKCKKCHFSNIFFKKMIWVSKQGVFDAAEYGGVVEFSLKSLPSEKKYNCFTFSREKKFKKC